MSGLTPNLKPTLQNASQICEKHDNENLVTSQQLTLYSEQ